MLAFILAPFYVLVNLYIVHWVLRWTGCCHRLCGTRAFRVIFCVVYAFAALSPLTGFAVQEPQWLRHALHLLEILSTDAPHGKQQPFHHQDSQHQI